MGIVALSQSTSRVISASLVLNDTVSVVKELLDNALDAHASNILVEVSANTLDVIQLKDNGIGIGVEDRQLLCKRACTSKIRTIDDLERLGGSSLGFRGEALASVAELSENITITTRVEGEMVGTLLKYGPAGQMLRSSRRNLPSPYTLSDCPQLIIGFSPDWYHCQSQPLSAFPTCQKAECCQDDF